MKRYHCSVCGTQLTARGDGLKSWTCPQHRRRFATVRRDLSGGKEGDKGARESAVTVQRHTKVERRSFKEKS